MFNDDTSSTSVSDDTADADADADLAEDDDENVCTGSVAFVMSTVECGDRMTPFGISNRMIMLPRSSKRQPDMSNVAPPSFLI